MKNEDKIREYYSRIDAGDVKWVLALFAKDGDYFRADAKYIGHDAIAEFYETGRKIQGEHSLENVLNHNNLVAVNGEFKGVGGDGSPKKIGFSDFWTFNDKGLVSLRKTYLAQGSDYVKE